MSEGQHSAGRTLSGLAKLAKLPIDDSWSDGKDLDRLPWSNGLRFRLHAARLIGGMVDIADAAQLLGTTVDTIEAWELGQVEFSSSVIDDASATYGVSRPFLTDGSPSTERDVAAARIARILQIAETDGVESDGWSTRLERIVERSELSEISDAADALRHLVITFVPHMAGQADPISIDLQISYALALRAKPEFAVLGHLQLLPRLEDRIDWWRPVRAWEFTEAKLRELMKAKAPPVEIEPPKAPREPRRAWSWLSKTSGAFINLACVELVEGRYTLAKRPMLLPWTILPAGIARTRPSVYGVLKRSRDGNEITLIDPRGTSGRTLLVSTDGRQRIGESPPDGHLPVDPLTLPAANSTMRPIGVIAGAISIEAEPWVKLPSKSPGSLIAEDLNVEHENDCSADP